MGTLGCSVTVILSCHVVAEVGVVVADQVDILSMFMLDRGDVEAGGEDAHDLPRGEFKEPGSREERWFAKLDGGPVWLVCPSISGVKLDRTTF